MSAAKGKFSEEKWKTANTNERIGIMESYLPDWKQKLELGSELKYSTIKRGAPEGHDPKEYAAKTIKLKGGDNRYVHLEKVSDNIITQQYDNYSKTDGPRSELPSESSGDPVKTWLRKDGQKALRDKYNDVQIRHIDKKFGSGGSSDGDGGDSGDSGGGGSGECCIENPAGGGGCGPCNH